MLMHHFHRSSVSLLLQIPSVALLQVGDSCHHMSLCFLCALSYHVDPGDYERLSESRSDLFFEDITATNNRSCIEVVINDDNLLEATENFSVEVVPDSFNHPTGLPPNFFLEPNLTVVEIINNDCK